MQIIKRIVNVLIVILIIVFFIYSFYEVELPPRYPNAKPITDFPNTPESVGIPTFEEIGKKSNLYRGDIFATSETLEQITLFYQEYATKGELTLANTNEEQLLEGHKIAYLYKSKFNKFVEIQIVTVNGQNYVALLKPRPAVSFISSWLGKTLFFLFDPQIEDIPKDLVNEHYGIREKIDDLWFDFLIIAHRIGLGRTPFLAVPISILAYVYGVTGSFELAIVTLGLLSFFLNMIVGGFVSIVIPFIIVTPSIIEMRYNLSRAKTPGRVKKWEDERQLIRLRLGSLLQGENLLWLFIREAVINLFSIVYVSGVLVSIWFFYDPTVYSRQIIASQALTIIPVNVLSKALLVPRGLILGIDWGGNNIVILPLFLGLIMSISRVINILVLSQTSKDMMDLASLIITYDPSSESKISLNQEFIIQGIVIPQFRLALAIGFIAPAAFQLFLLTLLLLPMFPNIRRLLADDTKQ